jgi:N-acyl-D-amino-acid deacylase
MDGNGTKPDLVIRNARLIDGTGAPARAGAIAVAGERIAGLGDLDTISGAREGDAGGRAVAPGFIDAHTHDDRALLADPLMTCKVSQGVTTVVAGNCGVSLAPLATAAPPPAPMDLVCAEPHGFYADFGDYLEALDNRAARSRPCAARSRPRWRPARSACRPGCSTARPTRPRPRR